jgi:hypothetical protein
MCTQAMHVWCIPKMRACKCNMWRLHTPALTQVQQHMLIVVKGMSESVACVKKGSKGGWGTHEL